MPHFFFRKPRRRMFRIVDGDELIVIRPRGVIDPGIRGRNLMKGKIRSRRQRRIIGIDLSDPKNSRRRAAISFLFAQAVFSLSGKPAAPGEPIFAEQDRHAIRDWTPGSGARAFKALQDAAHRIPIRGEADNQLLTVGRHPGGMHTAADDEQQCPQFSKRA